MYVVTFDLRPGATSLPPSLDPALVLRNVDDNNGAQYNYHFYIIIIIVGVHGGILRKTSADFIK